MRAISPSSKSKNPERSKINPPYIRKFCEIIVAEIAEMITPEIVRWLGVILVFLRKTTIGFDR